MSKPITIEFIIAEENQAQIVAGSMLENGDYRYFRCLQLDIAALAELYFLLTKLPYSENYLQEFSVLSRSRDNKTLVIRMPQSFVQALINADGQLSNVAEHWQEKRGISLKVWHDEYRRQVVANLIELAQQANARKTGLLLRVKV